MISELSTRDFTVNPEARTFTTCASDVGRGNPQRMVNVISHTTGNYSAWIQIATLENEEGELTGWVYAPIERDKRRYPAMKDFQLTIFND